MMETFGYDIHVHQLVAQDLVVAQLAYALLVIHNYQKGEESLKVKVFQWVSVRWAIVPVGEMIG